MSAIRDERNPVLKEKETSPFFYQTLLLARPLFQLSPLTKSLEQANLIVKSKKIFISGMLLNSQLECFCVTFSFFLFFLSCTKLWN